MLTFLILSLSALQSHATVGRVIKVQGFLVSRGKTQALLKDDKGSMKVPAEAIDPEHVQIGQWTTVSLDFVEFYRMNPDKFKAKTDIK